MKKISAVIFDLDGVIVDSEPLSIKTWKQALEDYNYKITEQEIRGYIGHSNAHIENALYEKYGANFQYEEIFAHKSDLFKDMIKRGKLMTKEGVKEVISFLHSKNIKICVASSTPRKDVVARLVAVDLLEQFEFILGGDDVQSPKPSPDLFLKAAELLNVQPEECLVVEDSNAGVEAAVKAGMRVCLVVDLITPTKDSIAKAEGYFKNHNELLNYFKSVFVA